MHVVWATMNSEEHDDNMTEMTSPVRFTSRIFSLSRNVTARPCPRKIFTSLSATSCRLSAQHMSSSRASRLQSPWIERKKCLQLQNNGTYGLLATSREAIIYASHLVRGLNRLYQELNEVLIIYRGQNTLLR